MKKTTIFTILTLISSIAFANYKISSTGIAHIKSYENCSLTAYPDAGGYSIGWGHHADDIRAGQKISQARADSLLITDIKEAERMSNWLLNKLPYKYKFNQGFIDGFVSLVYNAGVGNVLRSEFYNRLKNCRVRDGQMNISDYNFTVAAVKHSCITSSGHKPRRVAEMNMMLTSI